MIAYKKEKLENAICYFANEHRKIGKSKLYQTMLYKYISFLEFESIKKIGRPVFDLTFIAMKNGPVPKEIYDRRFDYNTNLFIFSKDNDKIVIIPKQKANLDYFSKFEIQEMERLVQIFADKTVKAKDMSDSSHSEIQAWKITWEKQKNSIIDKTLTFGCNIKNKNPEDLTFQEESFLDFIAQHNNVS